MTTLATSAVIRARSAVVVAVVIAAVGGAACSTPASSTTQSTTTTTTRSNASPPTSAAPAAIPSIVPTTILPPAPVGGLVSLPAIDPNPAVQVTLVKFVDPAQGADQFAVPVPGDRYVGVQLQIAYAGPPPPPEDFNSDTTIEDSQGNLYSASDAALQNCPAFNSGAKSPKGTTLGCVTFEVSTDATIADVMFTPLGQFGSISAEWKVS
jgi:hypothetical protein